MAGKNELLPVARKEGLAVTGLAEETIIYDIERHKAHCLNQTAMLIWKHCDGRTTVKQMTAILEEELNAPVTEEMVWFGLDRLGRNRLLEEVVTLPTETGRLSRREVVRRLGLASMVALPVITSIVSPTAVAAATICRITVAQCGNPNTNGCCCNNNKLCNQATGNCNGATC
jgi:hypothetical protein